MLQSITTMCGERKLIYLTFDSKSIEQEQL